MKLPDLSRFDDSGVLEYHGHPDAIAAAAGHAKLRYLNVDLGQAEDKATDREAVEGALRQAAAPRGAEPTPVARGLG